MRASHVQDDHLEAPVPHRARTGRVDLVTAGGESRRVARHLAVLDGAALGLDADTTPRYFAGAAERPAVVLSSPNGGAVQVRVLDAVGVVAVLNIQAQPGETVVEWDGLVDGGPAPSGRYRLEVAPGGAATMTGSPGAFAFYDHVFPIAGPHDLGQSQTNNFGGGRGHQGQDLFARCGTPLRAARGGEVRYAGYHGQAGNYVVIQSAESRLDYVYMHLRGKPTVATGDTVLTGQALGEVGRSGNANGCHLHFELWSAPGWQAGGKAVDPLRRLRAWDLWS